MKNGVIIALVWCGGIGLIVITIAILQYWEKWRKRAITEAGKSLGFHRLAQGEILPVVLVPLVNTPHNKYFLILRREINGYEAGFFDLFIGAGKNWFYQSTVIVKNPQVTMPKFQLKSSDWSHVISQRTCGDELKIPGREGDMGSLSYPPKIRNGHCRHFPKLLLNFSRSCGKENGPSRAFSIHW